MGVKKQGIYCIEHRMSGKKYYGSSMNISRRLTRHRSMLKHNTHHNAYLQRAVNKYGIDAFEFYIVEETHFNTIKELHAVEEKYVDGNVTGYNIGSVGGGDNLSNHPRRTEIIQRRTDAQRNVLESLTSEERKEKYGKPGNKNPRWIDGRSINTKKICPVCDKQEIGLTANTCNKCNKIGESNPFYGKKHSEKTLDKLKGNTPWTANATPEEQSYTKCYEITYPDNTVKIVYGMKTIAEEFGVSVANVHASIKRMISGKIPIKSVFKNHMIKQIDRI